MAKRAQPDQKMLELKRTSTLNPHPESVIDPLFKQNPFFEPRDLLQVRYEMLRRHSTEAMSILDAAAAFGVSRPTFYQAQSAFSRAGLAGLLPGQRGPKGGHKVTSDVLDYVASLRAAEPAVTTVRCIQAVQEHFGITIHRRSLERALGRGKKTPPPDLNTSFAAEAAETYEALRPHLVDRTGQHGAAAGRAALLRHGMIAWASPLNQASTSPVTVRPPTLAAASSDIATELVRFIASLILNSGKDRCYA